MATDMLKKTLIGNNVAPETLGTEYVEKANFDGFILIGAGLPRTGTSSLKVALSHLLKGLLYRHITFNLFFSSFLHMIIIYCFHS